MKNIWYLLLVAALGACGGGESTLEIDNRARFVALTSEGTASDEDTRTACIWDKRTNLIWERKSDSEGLHHWQNTYSWFYPDEAHNELDYRGRPNAGSCAGSPCDTWSVVAAANEEKLCGHDDWRMPSRDELFSVSDLLKAKSPPTIDTDFFPHTQAAEYWSANDYSFQSDSAWAWNFQYGHDRVDWKKAPKFVRLVRGAATELASVKE